MRQTILMARRKNIALIAHDNRKEELLKWARDNLNLLGDHSLYATRTTGQLLKHRLGLNVTLLESGPLGGDQQIGSRITENQIDFLIFFLDPLEVQPHGSDVKARGRVEHSGRMQSRFCRLHHLIATDVNRIRAHRSRLLKLQGRLLVCSLPNLLGAGLRAAKGDRGLASAGDTPPPNNNMQTTAVRADQ